MDLLRDVQKPRYAVLGNHDSLVKVPEMEAAGIKFLLNETEVIERGDAALYLVGIDDPNFYQSHNFLACLKRCARGCVQSPIVAFTANV